MAPLFLPRRTPAMPPSVTRPLARPSIFDRFLGRGSYMKEFSTRRAGIIKNAQVEKRRLSEDFRRQRRKYELKLRDDDLKLYQKFNIKRSMRGSKPGLADPEQIKVRKKTWIEIQRQMRLQHRKSERAIEHARDREIKDMRDELRETPIVPDEDPQVLSFAAHQRNQQSSIRPMRRAA